MINLLVHGLHCSSDGGELSSSLGLPYNICTDKDAAARDILGCLPVLMLSCNLKRTSIYLL